LTAIGTLFTASSWENILRLIQDPCLCGSCLRDPQETVPRIVRVNVESGDRVTRVVASGCCALAGTSASTWGVERSDRPTASAQEAVIDVARVNVQSRDRSRCVNVLGQGTLPGASACARNIERSDRAVRGAHETVIHIA